MQIAGNLARTNGAQSQKGASGLGGAPMAAIEMISTRKYILFSLPYWWTRDTQYKSIIHDSLNEVHSTIVRAKFT